MATIGGFDAGKDWKRRDKTVHKYDFRDLPNQIDTQLLATEAPEVPRDRGIGRVIQTLAEASQANFDHLAGQARKATSTNNVHAADTAYIKRELLPHEHPSGGLQTGFYPGTWQGPFVHGNWVPDIFFDDELVLVPFWAGEPGGIDLIGLNVYNDSGGNATVQFGVYAGDNVGYLPGTLLGNSGDITLTTMGDDTADVSINFDAGWLWLGVIQSAHTADVYVQMANSTLALGSAFDAVVAWWPFSGLDTVDYAPGSAETLNSFVYDGSGGWPATLDPADALYSVLGPFIEVRLA